jgi:hypothetical protein
MATRKLDKEHLEQIQALRQQYADNTNLLGNLSIEKFTLTRRIEEVKKLYNSELAKFDSIRLREEELMQKLQDRYGDGSIDIEAGTFTES